MLFIKNITSLHLNYSTFIDQEQMVLKCYGPLNFTFFKEGLNISFLGNNSFYKYDEIIKYQLNVSLLHELNFDLVNVSNDIPDKYLTAIISSIKLTDYDDEHHDVIFIGRLNITKIEEYKALLHGNLDFYVVFDTSDCYWEKKNPPPLDFIDYDKIKDHWKKVCIYTNNREIQSMFHYTDDEVVKIKYIGPKQLLIMIIVGISVFILILVTTFGILIYRYKKANKNDSLKED